MLKYFLLLVIFIAGCCSIAEKQKTFTVGSFDVGADQFVDSVSPPVKCNGIIRPETIQIGYWHKNVVRTLNFSQGETLVDPRLPQEKYSMEMRFLDPDFAWILHQKPWGNAAEDIFLTCYRFGFWYFSIIGDVDQSGKTNLIDLAIVKNHYGEALNDSNFLCDLNCDGSINLIDMAIVKANIH